MPDDRTLTLLASSFEYARAKRAFEVAISEARTNGWPDDEIAHVTGLSVAMVEAVAGKSRRPS